MADIKLIKLIDDLSWNKSEEEQRRAMDRIRKFPGFEYDYLIRFGTEKDCWDNCAKLICELPDERLKSLIPRLLEWLQDMNWPGAYTVFNRLMALPSSMLKRPFEITVLRADLMKDDLWIESLALFCDKKELMCEINAEVRMILENAKNNE